MTELFNSIDAASLVDAASLFIGTAAVVYLLAVIPGILLEALNDDTDYR